MTFYSGKNYSIAPSRTRQHRRVEILETRLLFFDFPRDFRGPDFYHHFPTPENPGADGQNRRDLRKCYFSFNTRCRCRFPVAGRRQTGSVCPWPPNIPRALGRPPLPVARREIASSSQRAGSARRTRPQKRSPGRPRAEPSVGGDDGGDGTILAWHVDAWLAGISP